MATSLSPSVGSTKWYKEIDHRLRVVTREIRAFDPDKKRFDFIMDSMPSDYSLPQLLMMQMSLNDRATIFMSIDKGIEKAGYFTGIDPIDPPS